MQEKATFIYCSIKINSSKNTNKDSEASGASPASLPSKPM